MQNKEVNKRIAVGVITRRSEGASSGNRQTQGPDVLVCRRSFHQTWAGYWEFPGGKIEKDETTFAALKRELAEEVGIHCLQAEWLLQYQHNKNGKILLEFWHITKYTGEPTSLEGQEVRWQPIDALSSLNFLPGNKEVIQFLYHYLQR